MRNSDNRPKRRRGTSALAMLLIVSCVACTTTTIVHTEQLGRLDGYGTHGSSAPEPELETLSGKKVAVGPDDGLILDVPAGRVGGQFDVIRVQDGVFSGQLKNGRVVEAPLAQVTTATIVQANKKVFEGVLVGVVVTGLLGALLVHAVSAHWIHIFETE